MAAPHDTTVLIVSGPPGVGKTTAAGILAERRERAVHLESDVFFRFIRAGRVEPWRPESHAQNEVVMRIVAGAASGYAAAGYLTVVEGIVIPGWFYEPLREALADAGHRVAYAVLREPLEVCAARVRGREGPAPLAEPGTLERIWSSFADLGELEPCAHDLGGRAPERTADLLEELLERELEPEA